MDNQKKQEAYNRLGVQRMRKFIKSARLVANLGNRNNYEGTPEKNAKIIAAVKAEAVNIEKALTSGTVVSDGFKW